jgi:hypothetical protein
MAHFASERRMSKETGAVKERAAVRFIPLRSGFESTNMYQWGKPCMAGQRGFAKRTGGILHRKREIKISCGIDGLASTLTAVRACRLHIRPHARFNEAEIDRICKHALNFI